ncbi:unnamed protein product [Malus baccata var. baccata]
MGKPTVLLPTRAFLWFQNEEKLTLPKQAHSNSSAQYYNMHYRILPSKALPGASLSSVGDTQMQEEETPGNGNGGSGGSQTHLWWAGASAAQLGWAAFAVASLYVGSIATAGVAGIRKVSFPFLALSFLGAEDLVELGANLRTGLGVPRRTTRDE